MLCVVFICLVSGCSGQGRDKNPTGKKIMSFAEFQVVLPSDHLQLDKDKFGLAFKRKMTQGAYPTVITSWPVVANQPRDRKARGLAMLKYIAKKFGYSVNNVESKTAQDGTVHVSAYWRNKKVKIRADIFVYDTVLEIATYCDPKSIPTMWQMEVIHSVRRVGSVRNG